MGLIQVNATNGVWSRLSEEGPFLHVWSGRIDGRSGPRILVDVLTRYGFPLTTGDIHYGRYGKPESGKTGKIRFNLTNDGDSFALAVTDLGDIGVDLQGSIDIEKRKRALDAVFTPDESEALIRNPGRFPASVYWAVKEALVKQEGSSIWFGIRLRVVDRLGRNTEGRWIELENRYVYASFRMGKGFALAVPDGEEPPEPVFLQDVTIAGT